MHEELPLETSLVLIDSLATSVGCTKFSVLQTHTLDWTFKGSTKRATVLLTAHTSSIDFTSRDRGRLRVYTRPLAGQPATKVTAHYTLQYPYSYLTTYRLEGK